MIESIAILCPGPSLGGFIAAPVEHDLHIGVNQAVEGFPCDWWAFLDAEAFERFVPMGVPACFTDERQYARIRQPAAQARVHRHHWLYLQYLERDYVGPDPFRFSMSAAIVLAAHLIGGGAEERKENLCGTGDLCGTSGGAQIVVYGCDWDGPEYFKSEGVVNAADHTKDRWGAERHVFGHLQKWLGNKGIRLERKENPCRKENLCGTRTGGTEQAR